MVKKILSALIASAMVLGTIVMPAFADGDSNTSIAVKKIMLNADGISAWNNTDGYDYLYYGYWTAPDEYTTTAPIKWRVLDTKTNTGNDGLFVLSENLFGSGVYGDVYFDTNIYYTKYQGSQAQNWCKDFEKENLTVAELAAIINTTKTDEAFTFSEDNDTEKPFTKSENILNDDKIFFLSAEEISNAEYGFTNDDLRIAYYGTEAKNYLLRSENTEYGHIGYVVKTGYVSSRTPEGWDFTVRPAFNLDTSKVLFTSPANESKESNGLNEIAGYTGNEWKATVLDSDREFNVAETTVAAVADGSKIKITYSGAKTGENEYVSAMIVDENDDILYYGQIANNSESGTVYLDIPSNLSLGEYTLNVFSEQLNDNYKTDYASAFEAITLTVADPYLSTETDSGYYAETKDGEATDGDVGFRTFFEKYADYTVDKYGFYIYKKADGSANAIEGSKDLADGNGYYTATITDVPVNTDVFAKPYVIIGEKPYYGEMVNISITGLSKWLGVKEAE